MATAAKLLADHGAVDTKHRQALRMLAAAVAAEAPNRRVIVAALKNAEEAYDILIQVQVCYVQKVGASMDNPACQNWIDTRGDAHHTGTSEAREAIELIDADPEAPENRRDVELVREEVQVLTLRINAVQVALEAAIAQNMNVEQHTALTENLDTLNGLLAEYRTTARLSLIHI